MATEVISPFSFFPGATGLAATGHLYVGVDGADPETNPIPVYWDDALTQAAQQPLDIVAGMAVRNGTPSKVYALQSTVSQTLRTVAGVVIYAVPSTSLNGLAGPGGAGSIGYKALQPNSVLRNGFDKFAEFYTIGDAGGTGNGTFDCTAAFGRMNVIGFGIVTAGTWRIASNITISADLLLMPGAKLKPDAGVTVTVTGSFAAPIAQIFTGAGTIDLTQADIVEAYPEWWGAQRENPSFDNRAALTACFKAFPVNGWLNGHYYVAETWKVPQGYSHRKIMGVGGNYAQGGNAGTGLRIASGTAPAMQLGPDTNPGGINLFTDSIEFHEVTFEPTVTPVSINTGDPITSGQATVLAQYMVRCEFHRCSFLNGIHGLLVRGVAYGFTTKCLFQQILSPTTGAGKRPFYSGHTIDASPVIGANTGTASYYVDTISVVGNDNVFGKNKESYGVYLASGMTDTSLKGINTSQINQGITGNGNPGLAYGSENLSIDGFDLDQVLIGISINAGQATTAVRIANGYIGCNGNVGPGCCAVQYTGTPTSGTGGILALTGNEFISATPGNTGIRVFGSTGLHSVNNQIVDFSIPIYLENAPRSKVADAISNPTMSGGNDGTNGGDVGGGAISAKNCQRLVVDCTVDGMVNAFPAGLDLLGTANAVVEYRHTGVDNGALQGGSAAKLRRNQANTPLTDGIATFTGGQAIGLVG